MEVQLSEKYPTKSTHAVNEFLIHKGLPILNGDCTFLTFVEVCDDKKSYIKMNVSVSIQSHNILGNLDLSIDALKYAKIGPLKFDSSIKEIEYNDGNLIVSHNGYKIIIYDKELPNFPYLNSAV